MTSLHFNTPTVLPETHKKRVLVQKPKKEQPESWTIITTTAEDHWKTQLTRMQAPSQTTKCSGWCGRVLSFSVTVVMCDGEILAASNWISSSGFKNARTNLRSGSHFEKSVKKGHMTTYIRMKWPIAVHIRIQIEIRDARNSISSWTT